MDADMLLFDGTIVLLVLVVFAVFSIIVRTLRNGVAPMPSSVRVRATMTSVLRELSMPPHGTVVELGSGWGSLSLALSRALPVMKVIGYENSPVPFWFSVIIRRLFRVDNLRLVRTDLYAVSLREAHLVVCYLSPDAMVRLQPKFDAELPPSAVVVSSTFALPSWKATQVIVADDMYRTRIYLYSVGACRSDRSGEHVDINER